MNMAGQSINDRLTAARYSLAGQGLAKSVCKATTEEVIGPKKKHLDYLLHCTNEPNVSIPQLANLLIERTQQQSWVIVYKALITVHHMMCYGNERFTQYLASSNCNFNLGGFLDKTGVAGQSQSHPQLSYDMSTFIRRYAKYINEKAVSYRTVAFDFCKVKRGKDDGTLRTMPTETLLKTLPVLQTQLDALLDFDCTANELTNGVINSAFMLLFRDLIRLFACYNDGIINLLEKYFEMNKKSARDALDCYKKFLIRMDRVSEFLKVAEAVGMDKSEIPDLKQAPSSLLDALEAHLASLEGKKVPIPGSATPASKVNIGDAVSALNSTSVSFGWVSSNGRMGEPGTLTNNGTEGAASPPVDELAKRAALAEEEAMYEKLRTEHSKNNPFLSSPTSETAPAVAATAASNNGGSSTILDLFGSADTEAAAQNAEASTKASDDLLQLAGNPFADMLSAPAPAAAPAPVTTQQPYTNGFSHPPAGSGFVTSNAFDAVFGNSSTGPPQTFDGFGDILKPEGGLGGGDAGLMGGTLLAGSQPVAPITTAASTNVTASGKIISGDLDMSLSSLVDNLNIKGAPSQKPGQWNSPKAQGKTGGASWTPAAPTAAMAGGGGFRPGMPATGAAQPQPSFPGGFPQQQQMGIGAGAGGMGMQQQTASPVPPQPTQTTATPFDPFGNL